MKTTKSYIYLSLDVSVWLRLYVFGTLALLVIIYGFKVPVPLWAAPVASTLALVLIFLVHLGVIWRTGSGSESKVVIRDLGHRLSLNGQLELDSWWHYIYRGESAANDILVILHVVDEEGKEVYFTETIMFETRHPNEVPFIDRHIPEDAHVVKIQRTDRLRDFLG